MKSKSDIEDWNTIAPAYSREIEAHGDRCFPEIREKFWELLGDVKGKAILDLGCGQGWLTGELANRGAKVIGVDGSDELIKRAHSLFPNQTFLVADLANGIPDMDLKFDLVISHMVVMDIPEIDDLFRSVALALKPDGAFLFTIPHPCFFMQKSFQDENGQWFKKLIGYLIPEIRRISSFGGHNHYHRPLSKYILALAEAGLLIFCFHEPSHESRSDRIDPEFLKNFPVFLMIGAKKIGEQEQAPNALPRTDDT